MAVLLSVPGTVVLAAIVHDLAPARRIKVLKLSGTLVCPNRYRLYRSIIAGSSG